MLLERAWAKTSAAEEQQCGVHANTLRVQRGKNVKKMARVQAGVAQRLAPRQISGAKAQAPTNARRKQA